MIDGNMSEECFLSFINIVHDITGITLGENRQAMLIGRIRKRIGELGLSRYETYLELVKKSSEEKGYFTNLITTNETYFYRTPRIWDFIEKSFLPNFYKENGVKALNIWSAAASTGDEAHTLGILCQNYIDEHGGANYQILGTDISSAVISKATDGLYKGRSIQRFRDSRQELFNKYMFGNDIDGYHVANTIKNKLKFKTHNLFNGFKNDEKFDLILLRNVLIYFTQTDQQIVLGKIRDSLSSNGILIIGESESLSGIETDFESVAPLIYRPKSMIMKKDAA